VLLKRLFYIALFFFLLGCNSDDAIIPQPEPELSDLISSICVAFAHSDERVQNFTAQPTQAYISGYFYFEEGLGSDIIFGLDIEWLEGLDNPVHIPGGDWMSLAGVNKEGILWFPIGSPENLEGTPTNTDKWEVKDLQISLQAKTWYKMTITSDFSKREFLSFRLEGNGIDATEDISGFPLEYPNYAPFDKSALTFYTFAIRSKEFAPNNEGQTKVFFDDLEAGIFIDKAFEIIFSDGFENQTTIEDIPVELPVIPMEPIVENYWYYENDEAKINIVSTISRSGNNSMECNASLELNQ